MRAKSINEFKQGGDPLHKIGIGKYRDVPQEKFYETVIKDLVKQYKVPIEDLQNDDFDTLYSDREIVIWDDFGISFITFNILIYSNELRGGKKEWRPYIRITLGNQLSREEEILYDTEEDRKFLGGMKLGSHDVIKNDDITIKGLTLMIKDSANFIKEIKNNILKRNFKGIKAFKDIIKELSIKNNFGAEVHKL